MVDSIDLLTQNILSDINKHNATHRRIHSIDTICDIKVVVSFDITKSSMLLQIEHKIILSTDKDEYVGFNGNIVMFEKNILFNTNNILYDEIKIGIALINHTLLNLKFNKLYGIFYENEEEIKYCEDVKYLTDIFKNISNNPNPIICIRCNEQTLTKTSTNHPLCLLCWKKDNWSEYKKYKINDLTSIKKYPIPPNIAYNSDNEEDRYIIDEIDDDYDDDDYDDDEFYDN